MSADLIVDLLLALVLLFLAARMLFDPDLFASAVLFIAFGLTMAIVWVRLAAPDVALAEAAVGAGLTGALILRAVGQMPSGGARVPMRLFNVLAIVTLSGTACLALVGILWSFDWPAPGLVEEVETRARVLGLEQRVNAVLLVFRGYDTWLELAVLLTTAVAVLGARPAETLASRRIRAQPDKLLATFARLLLPVAVVLAGYLTWQGTKNPGGAFQGGAVLAAALALGYLAGLQVFSRLRSFAIRIITVLAVALPGLLTIPALVEGEQLLSYPETNLGQPLLLIEVVLAISLAFTLAALLVGAEPEQAESRERERLDAR